MAYKRSKLTLGDVWEYDYSILKNQDEKVLRKEYSRLRDIAQKRIQRLSQSEWTWTQNYQKHKEGFAKLDELKDKSDLAHELADLGHFVYSKASAISGLEEIREKSIESLHLSGYNFITSKNWEMWTQFMNSQGNLFSGGSPTPEELKRFENIKNIKTDPKVAEEQFNQFMMDNFFEGIV